MTLGLMNCLKKILGMLGMSMKRETALKNAPDNSTGATRVLQPAYTVRLKPGPEEPASAEAAVNQDKRLPLAWHGLSDKGVVRGHNEDSFSHADLGKNYLFVVADGMGGHDAGEVASKLAVETVMNQICAGAKQEGDPQKLIKEAVQRANKKVKQEGANRGSDMGTTLNAAFVAGDTAYVANVGDSRTYWIENGTIAQITEDHSLVAKLVQAGKLTREDARNHPRANLLYRTIGNEDTVKVDTFQVPLKKGGSLLLCTDGLWGEVTDEEIHAIVKGESNAANACARLIKAANKNGGKDNITAIVVNIL